jgi:Protein ENHANCED DISEASE RESISTANCE 2, C-terminal
MAVVTTAAPTRPEHLADRSVSEKIPAAASMIDDDLTFVDAKEEESDLDEDVEQILEEKKMEEGNEDCEDVSLRFSSSSSPSRPILRRSQTEPTERHPTTYRFHPPPLRTQAWSEPPAETFMVRGKNYMNDRIKVPSQQAAFRLFAVDLVNTEEPMHSGMCAHPGERVQLALQRELETGIKELPEFVFCINLCVPGSINYHNVYYFGADKAIMEEIRNMSTPFGRLMNEFLYGDSDEFRNRTFKLIPRIVEGNYIVRRAVGSKPTILGRKIKQYYLKTDRYMEVLVDIASEPIAQRVTKLCMGYLQSMTVDMMFLLEGNSERELPERVFGGARLCGVDFKEQDGKRTVSPVD